MRTRETTATEYLQHVIAVTLKKCRLFLFAQGTRIIQVRKEQPIFTLLGLYYCFCWRLQKPINTVRWLKLVMYKNTRYIG